LPDHKSPFNSLMGRYAKLGVISAVLTYPRVPGECPPIFVLSGLIYYHCGYF
jgi:hypothetical protein